MTRTINLSALVNVAEYELFYTDAGRFNLSLFGGRPKGGYLVGGAVPESIILNDREGFAKVLEDLAADLVRYASETEQSVEGLYLGAWVNPETDFIHLDVSEHFQQRRYALEMARLREEIAIWDVVNKRDVLVTDEENI